jgi:hypothetical protein
MIFVKVSYAKPQPIKNIEEVKHFSRGILGSLSRVYFDGAWRNMREHTSIPIAAFDKARDRILNHINLMVPETGTITGDEPEFLTETSINANTLMEYLA